MNIKELAEKVGVSSDIEDNFIFDAAQLKALVDLVRGAAIKKEGWDCKCDGCGKPIENHTKLLHCPHGVDDGACKDCYDKGAS